MIHHKRTRRRGATLVETTLVTSAFMMLLLGMLDLGLGVMRHNTLSHAARQGARQAVVHGSLSSSPWGSSAYGPVTADTNAAIPNAIRPHLTGMPPAEVNVSATWPDGGNAQEHQHRVQVTVNYAYTPMLTYIFGNFSVTLSATSTMYIAH